MSEAEIESYLAEQKDKLEKISERDSPEYGKHCYEYAQLLVAVGRHKLALPFFEDSLVKLQSVKKDDIWKRFYCSVGGQYAAALDYLNDFKGAEAAFNDVMRVDPVGFHIGEYALFLHRRKRDFDRAEKFYLKALEQYPDHSSIHLKYAGLLRHVRRDLEGAEKHYALAVKANGVNSDAIGSYASFLHGVHGNIDGAEKYYKQAIEVDDCHTNNLCNYGLFLSEEKQSYELAEQMYKRSLDVNPEHANTLYNYAVMLDTHLKRKEEAEALYRRALAMEPRHAYALYNLAVLLEERYSQYVRSLSPALASVPEEQTKDQAMRQEIQTLYQRAVDADPRDTATLADFGRFLLVRMENASKAEGILEAALKMDEDCEIAMFNLAVLLHRYKFDLDAAEQMLRRLLKKAPQHSAGTLQMARLLSEKYSKKQAVGSGEQQSAQMIILFDDMCSFYERALPLLTEPGATLAEYIKLVEKYGTYKQKLRTITNMSQFVDDQKKANAKRVIAHGASLGSGGSSAGDGSASSTIEQMNLLNDAQKALDKIKKDVE